MADKPDDVSALSICPKLVVPEMAGPEMTEPDIEWSETLQRIRVRTPARLLAGRVGAAYRTHTQLELRKAPAAARHAAGDELHLEPNLPPPSPQPSTLSYTP